MRLSRKTWLILIIAIFVIGAIVLYMLYQGQADKRQEARDELRSAQDMEPMLLAQKRALDAELIEKENELAKWEDILIELEERAVKLEITLSQKIEAFPVSAESIEYDEKLFLFSHDHNIEMNLVTASEQVSEQIDDVTYETASFSIQIDGEVADILAFINTMVIDVDFRTAVIQPVNIVIPDPVNDEQREILEEDLRALLTTEALAEMPIDEIVRFTLEAIDDVVGDEHIDQSVDGNDGQLDALSIAEMATTIKERIADSIFYIEQNYEEPLATDLAELIAESIPGSVISPIVDSLAEKIVALIVPAEVVQGEGEGEELGGEVVYDQAALIELLGEDMAALLGESIAGVTRGQISNLLNNYIAGLIENRMLNSVADSVEEAVETTLPINIEAMEMPSANMEIVIYLYQGEGR
ncbi:hypothetical protein ACFLYB_01845 [Chloroflexota bacterium]